MEHETFSHKIKEINQSRFPMEGASRAACGGERRGNCAINRFFDPSRV
jgi:hypothetical protein